MMFKCLNGGAPNYLSDKFRHSAQIYLKIQGNQEQTRSI